MAYLAVLPSLPSPVAGTDAADADWEPVDDMLSEGLPFDHHGILAAGVARARNKLEYTTLATAFVEPAFTMAELRHVYKVVWDRTLDPATSTARSSDRRASSAGQKANARAVAPSGRHVPGG